MLEVAPGVYVSPDLSSGVRERVWGVLEDWFTALGNGAVVMLWRGRHRRWRLGAPTSWGSAKGDPRRRRRTPSQEVVISVAQNAAAL